MAGFPAVVLVSAKLVNDDLRSASVRLALLGELLDHLAGDLGALDERLTEARFLAVRNQKDAIECDHVPFFARQLLDIDGVAGLDLVLFSTCFDDGIHGSTLR